MKSLRDQLSKIKNSLGPSKRTKTVSSTKSSNALRTETTSSEKKYKFCPECGCKLRISRYSKHMVLQHGQASASIENIGTKDLKSEQDEIVKCPTCSAPVKKSNLQKHISRIHQSPKPKKKKKKQGKGIHLISKRGMTLSGRHCCTNCNKVVDNPTRYANSNMGAVVLCATCKSKIRLRSFQPEKRDALDFATTGGRFEGNRRKH